MAHERLNQAQRAAVFADTVFAIWMDGRRADAEEIAKQCGRSQTWVNKVAREHGGDVPGTLVRWTGAFHGGNHREVVAWRPTDDRLRAAIRTNQETK